LLQVPCTQGELEHSLMSAMIPLAPGVQRHAYLAYVKNLATLPMLQIVPLYPGKHEQE